MQKPPSHSTTGALQGQDLPGTEGGKASKGGDKAARPAKTMLKTPSSKPEKPPVRAARTEVGHMQ